MSLGETVYLFRSPANAQRLLDAIEESKSGQIHPQSIAQLCEELDLEQKEEADT
jgi:antitoxin YefM